MVTVKSHEERINEKGEPFNVLILEGELEMVQAEDSGKFYATCRRASIPSTFSAEECEDLIGTQIPGIIEKVPAEPYEYITDSGDQIILEHTYQYRREASNIEEHVFEGQQNGVPEVEA